jgi:orotidine-5'-phosphate decarboxylase
MGFFDQEKFNDFVIDNDVMGFFEEPITLVSGRKSYFYFNWRDVLSDVWLTDKLVDFVFEFVRDLGLGADCFYGVPEGATKLGVLAQDKWAKRSVDYNKSSHTLAMGRAKPKEHGDPKDKFFVGMPKGKTVVIEDVTNTGGSLVRTLDGLKNAGVNVIAVLSLTNRMMKNDEGISVKESVESRGVKFYNMSSSLEVFPEALKKLQPTDEVIEGLGIEFDKYGVEKLKMPNKLVVDKLIEKIDERQNPCVIGLDPQVRFLPEQIKKDSAERYGDGYRAVAEAFIEFNKGIIDATCDLVPAFKPNMCFYEKYGAEGVRAFKETVDYVKSKGCVVIEDAKRNELGESSKAYAEGHLGEVDMCDGTRARSLDVDILVVNPYLGSDGIVPFVNVCEEYGKGIFVLAKTSNPSSGEFQDKLVEVSVDEKIELDRLGISIGDKTELYNLVALRVNKYAQQLKGKFGYSLIGAVVGATYPEQAKSLRKIMPNSVFLVPGYGAQGGAAESLVNCFNRDGYGAVVNSSRGIIFAYKKDFSHRERDDSENFAEAARDATKRMIDDIKSAMKGAGKFPKGWER